MSLIQCPGCAATVEASKSYCPECGAPMEEELENNSASEFDSMMRTQNINKTTQLRMLEEFNLSGFFQTPTGADEPALVETEPDAPAPPIQRQEPLFDPSKTQTIILSPQIELPATAAKKPEVAANSNKKLFVVLGAGLVFFILIVVGLVIAGLLYRFYSR